MKGALGLALALALALPGCGRRTAPVAPNVAYTVGAGYQAGGTWFYPREDFHAVETGLAITLPDRRGRTADGEVADATVLTAAHQTLQLPCIVRVTNLATGLQLAVRVNDRGPDTPKRLLGVSRRAAELLGMRPGEAAPVRVEVDEARSLALREQLKGGPTLAVQAAPRAAVTSESLAPPAGIGQSSRGRSAGATQVATGPGGPTAPTVPDRLPETVLRVPVAPAPLSIRAGTFGQMSYARQVSARLTGIGARVERVPEGRTERYRVSAGPFRDVAAADAALDQALRAGVSDARIVVE